MELTRTQILNGNYIYPNDLVHLKQTRHVKERILDRYTGFIIVPKYIRVSRDNIHSAKCEDGKHLHSVVVRLDYDSRKYLFVCFNPFDCALKTIWFTDKKKIYERNNKKNNK